MAVKWLLLLCPRRTGALSGAAIRPFVCPSLSPMQHVGQAARAVQTADPSVHGRRSAAIGGGQIISPRHNLLLCFEVHFLSLLLPSVL